MPECHVGTPAPAIYFFVYTDTLLTACPLGSVPVLVRVSVFPSADTLDLLVMTTLPAFL
jgi:hypothetical protein